VRRPDLPGSAAGPPLHGGPTAAAAGRPAGP